MVSLDTIDHDFLLRTLGDVPGKELIRQWLKAGILEEGVYHDTLTGTPQGGVISPLLMNVALHGLEAALGIGGNARERAVVRYADDFVVFCTSQEDALRVKDVLLPPWLAERGLSLSSEKTRVVHLSEGFDFLSYNVRHYRSTTTRTGWKLLIKPSHKAGVNKRREFRDIWLELKGHRVKEILYRLNPIIRGWANYHRTVVASATFARMDRWMFHRTARYVNRMHPDKSQQWKVARYWGKLNKERDDDWVFGDKQTGQYLLKFKWFKIERHQLVRGTASPDDPSLKDYWWSRRTVNIRHLSDSDMKIVEAQDYRCPICGEDLINGEVLHRHHRVPRSESGSDSYSNRELVHLYCHQQIHARERQC